MFLWFLNGHDQVYTGSDTKTILSFDRQLGTGFSGRSKGYSEFAYTQIGGFKSHHLTNIVLYLFNSKFESIFLKIILGLVGQNPGTNKCVPRIQSQVWSKALGSSGSQRFMCLDVFASKNGTTVLIQFLVDISDKKALFLEDSLVWFGLILTRLKCNCWWKKCWTRFVWGQQDWLKKKKLSCFSNQVPLQEMAQKNGLCSRTVQKNTRFGG